MRRTETLQKILDLDVYEDILVAPESGEELAATIKRLKMRTSKYRRLHEKTFVVEAEGNAARVTRIPFDSSKRYWRWIKLNLGEKLVLSEQPTPRDIEAAYQSAQYINYSIGVRGVWQTRLDGQGRLITVRVVAEDGTSLEDLARARKEEAARLRPPIPRWEELERQASNWEQTSRWNMEQAQRTTGGMVRVLTDVAEKFQARADALREEATVLRSDAERKQTATDRVTMQLPCVEDAETVKSEAGPESH